MQVYAILYYVPYGHVGEFLICNKNIISKDHTSSRSVSINSYLCYDTSCSHRRGRGDKKEN